MQSGHELDEKVAEALGYTRDERQIAVNAEPCNGYVIGGSWYSHIPSFSTAWRDMGVLIELARRQGVLIDIETLPDRYKARAFRWNGSAFDEVANAAEGQSAPHIVCDVFLQAKSAEI